MVKSTHIFALTLLLAFAVPAHGAKLLVANYGVDDPSCGSKTTPCRSLSQAIANAAAGDKIVVGPGRYGDLDDDGAFTSPGEEDAELDTGCDCMVDVTKRLTITSSDGAGATILDAGGADLAVVEVSADGVVFGKKKKGFTLTGSGDDNGLVTDEGTSGIAVAGNRALNNSEDGFQLNGDDHEVTDNEASNNGDVGVEVNGDRFLVKNNSSTGNDYGFYLEDESGTQAGTVFTGNVATENDDGIFVDTNASGVVMKGSISYANGSGLSGGGVNLTVEKCSFIGNEEDGVITDPSSSGMVITKTNIFGNDDGDMNCGFRNQSATAPTISKSFWGAASGPGANPADVTCGGVPPILEKNATKEIKVKVKAAQ